MQTNKTMQTNNQTKTSNQTNNKREPTNQPTNQPTTQPSQPTTRQEFTSQELAEPSAKKNSNRQPEGCETAVNEEPLTPWVLTDPPASDTHARARLASLASS